MPLGASSVTERRGGCLRRPASKWLCAALPKGAAANAFWTNGIMWEREPKTSGLLTF